MRIFFIKAFSLVIIISLMFNVLGTLADRVAPLEDWRVEHQQKVADLQARNDLIEAITLGNSHSESIDYSVLGIEGQSLAFAAADLFEIEKYAETLDGKLPGLRAVFIAISYYSFSWDNAKQESLRSRRIRFYSMVPVGSPIQGDIINFFMGKLEAYTHVMSVVRSDSWKGIWLGLLTDTPPPPPFVYDGVHTSSVWGECFHYTAEQLDPHALHVAGRNVSNSIQMANAHPGLEQDSFDALARTIERLQSRGIRVVLYTPAYHEKYNLIFAEGGSDIIDHMRLAVGKLQQTYEVEYYDFSDDPELTTHPELFYNSDHLSDCGRRVMSAKLLELINENSQLDK
jgi:hypothetical protein